MDETRATQEGGNGGGLTYQEAHLGAVDRPDPTGAAYQPGRPLVHRPRAYLRPVPLADSRPRDADWGQLLDRMGLYSNARYRRSTRGLAEALRECTKLADARIEAESVRTYTFTPGLAPHIYTIR